MLFSVIPGLNPLIYTISAVILLGTLAIVAIITCWIRARRSFNNRIFRPSTTPQDYFDYINDNEFTPLTSSEFAASLQERPPTYVESERIEQTGENSESDENRVPPIIPPPHVLPSLTRLRVVQIQNISSIADGAHANEVSTPRSDTLVAGDVSGGSDATATPFVPTTNLVDITDNNQSTNVDSLVDMDDDPLYT